MGSSESTAVNDLIELMQRKPLPRQASDNWLFGNADEHTEIDDPQPRLEIPTVPFERARMVSVHEGEVWQPTIRVKPLETKAPAARSLTIPLVAGAVFVVAIGGYFLFRGKHEPATKRVEYATAVAAKSPEPSLAIVLPPAPAAEPAAASAPAADPPAAPAPAADLTTAPAAAAAPPAAAPVAPPARADVQTLPSVVPTLPPPTPTIAAAAPPASADRAEAPAPSAPEIAAPAAQPVAKARHHHHDTKRVARAASTARAPHVAGTAPSGNTPRVAAADWKPAAKTTSSAGPAVKLGGKGLLQLSSNPPADIYVDGHSLGQQTPARIPLAAGTHKISLFEKAHHIARTFEVEIQPNQSLKVSRQLK